MVTSRKEMSRCQEATEKARPKKADADKVAWADHLRQDPAAVAVAPSVAVKPLMWQASHATRDAALNAGPH